MAECRIPTRAIDGARTRDPELGKLMLYQLSYYRITGYAFLTAKVHNSANNRKHLRIFLILFGEFHAELHQKALSLQRFWIKKQSTRK